MSGELIEGTAVTEQGAATDCKSVAPGSIPGRDSMPAQYDPLGMDPAQFSQQLQHRRANYDALAEHLRNHLVPDHDFGVIKGSEQLLQPGADKVLGILGLGAVYPGEQDLLRASLTGKTIAEVILKAVLVTHTGQAVAEGLGACARQEVGGSLNNAIKRAAKRARVDAVKRLPSISALFEPDNLAAIRGAAKANGGNSTLSRSRQPQSGRYASGAELEAMPFGKYKGMRFADMPDEYLDWITHHMSDKPDIHAAAVRELEKRQPAPAEPERPDDEVPPDYPPADYYDDDIPFP